MTTKNRVFLSLITLLALWNTLAYWAIKPIWFFIDQDLGSVGSIENFWSNFIYALLVIFTVYTITLFMVMHKKLSKFHIINLVLWSLVFSSLNMYLVDMMASEKHILLRNIYSVMPIIILSGCALFFILLYPRLKISKNRMISGGIAVVVLSTVLIFNSNVGDVKITSGPYIQYVNDDQMAIMWTTNRNSTGWLEYGQNEETMQRVTMSENGIIDGNSKRHKVIIDNLNKGMIFRVGSTKIKDYFQNNVVYGNTTYSDFVTFDQNNQEENFSFYVLSDVHEREDIYEKYLSGNDYDFIVLNGDILSSIDSEDVIVDEMLKPLTAYNTHVKPFYFVRGNHETRGASVRALDNYIALPDGRYYYTFTYGSVFVIVLDSAEDKVDSHKEYGGLADFESYREVQTKWLESVVQSETYLDAEYKIAFSHMPLDRYGDEANDSPLKTYEENWVTLLNEMAIDVLISGHTHSSEVIDSDEIREFPMIVGGGYVEDNSGYEGIKVTVEEGQMLIEFVTESGQKRNAYTITN